MDYKDYSVLDTLTVVNRFYSDIEIAKQLQIDITTLNRWRNSKTLPKAYVKPALNEMLLTVNIPKQKKADFTFIDLFAGIGGIRKGFEKAKGKCVFTAEWDLFAQRTYNANYKSFDLIAGDITTVNEKCIPNHDVLLAGFPCQPFSLAGVSKKKSLGRAHGFSDITQGTLFFDIVRIIKEKNPKLFVLENVKNLVSHDKGRTFEIIRSVLENELNYTISYQIIDGQHWVPQHRERIVIVGTRERSDIKLENMKLPPKGVIRLNKILHKTDGTEPYIVSDGNKYFNHENNCVNQKYTLTDNLWAYLKAYAEKHRSIGNGFGFSLVGENDIARTLSARYYKDGSEILIFNGKGNNPRRLTPRECARLMGYDDNYIIPVSDTRAYKQFGNSVVVPMFSTVAAYVKPYIT